MEYRGSGVPSLPFSPTLGQRRMLLSVCGLLIAETVLTVFWAFTAL